MDQKLLMNLLHLHGGALIRTIVGSSSCENPDEETVEQYILEFIKDKQQQLNKDASNIKEEQKTASAVLKPLPLELYRQDQDILQRRRIFFKNLNRLDVLYLQILDCTDPNKYTLLVLAKHGILAKLEDLSLDVYLPRLHKDQIFNDGDLIKAAIWSCSIDDRRLYVTLDDTVFEGSDVPAVKLGRIEPSDLPYYITCSKIGQTYSEYVKESKEYKSEGLWLKELKDFGFDTHSFHSFFEEWDGKIYPAAENYTNLKQKLDLEDSVLMMNKSIQHFDAGNIDRSFKYINEALSMKPDNVMALVYRGTLYANVGKLRQALIDTEEALRIDPAFKRAKQQMSQLLVSASEVHFIDKSYFKWKECVALARSYDSSNREAKGLMDIANIEFPDKKAISERNIALPKIEEVRRIYERAAPNVEKRMSKRKNHRKQPRSRHSHLNRHKKHK